MSIGNNHNFSFSDIIAYFCIVFASYVALDEQLNSYALFMAIPVAFCICFLSYDTLSNNKSLKILLTLYIWLAFCSLFSLNSTAANAELQKVLGCFILSYTVASLAQKRVNIPWLYILYCLLLIFAWRYANEHIIDDIIFGEDRLNDDILNANHLAYYTFYVTISVYILGDIIKTSVIRRIFRILFWGTLVLSFYTAIFTASRQVMMIQIPLFFSLMVIRYLMNTDYSLWLRSVIILFGIIASIYLYNDQGASIYDNSLLQERSSTKVEDDDRARIAEEAIELAKEHPIVGYGPGNAMYNISTKHFTHNTFLELLVNSGIIGMAIFVWLIISFLKTQYQRWRETKDRLFFFFLIFGVFWTIDQVFYVFYADLWLISFFILISAHSDIYYKDYHKRLCITH